MDFPTEIPLFFREITIARDDDHHPADLLQEAQRRRLHTAGEPLARRGWEGPGMQGGEVEMEMARAFWGDFVIKKIRFSHENHQKMGNSCDLTMKIIQKRGFPL